jgi:hypothetical protein
LAHGTAIATMAGVAASRTVPAETPSPRAATTAARDSGPRLFAIRTLRPARSAVRASACPMWPAPMIPIVPGWLVAGGADSMSSLSCSGFLWRSRPGQGAKEVDRREDLGSAKLFMGLPVPCGSGSDLERGAVPSRKLGCGLVGALEERQQVRVGVFGGANGGVGEEELRSRSRRGRPRWLRSPCSDDRTRFAARSSSGSSCCRRRLSSRARQIRSRLRHSCHERG